MLLVAAQAEAVVFHCDRPGTADRSIVTPVRDRPGNERHVTTLFWLSPSIQVGCRGWFVTRQERVLVWVEDPDVWNALQAPVRPSWLLSRTLG